MLNEFDVMNFMNNIKYGYVSNDGIIHKEVDSDFNNYRLQSPSELMNSCYGVCWDQVELERYLFKDIYKDVKTYFIVHYDDEKCPTHTFLVYENNNKYYWFEHSWEICRGIHEYNSIDILLDDVKNKFVFHELDNDYDIDNLCIYEYGEFPNYNDIGIKEFYKHCENSKKIV